MKQLANPLSHQRTVAKWLVITQHKDAGQVIGYSHLTDGTTTRSANNTDQVAGYRLSNALHSHLTKLANYATKSLVIDSQVIGYNLRKQKVVDCIFLVINAI